MGQVLQMLEAKAQTARVRFETEVGDGEVDVVQGQIVDAFLGDALGKSALFSLLGATEGRFEITYQDMQPRPVLVTTVAQLLAERTRRAAEWKSLSERGPALSSILGLTPEGREAVTRSTLPAHERSVLGLIDERRTLTDIIGESQLDAVQAFKVIVGAVEQGWVVEGVTARASAAAAPGFESGRGSFARLPEREVTALSSISLRKRTSIGIGIPDPIRPKTPETTQVLPAGTTAGLEPVPVLPVRRHRQSESAPPPPVAPPSSSPMAALEPPVAHDSNAPPARGRKYIERYELLCRIGYGGMGSVYLCRLSTEGGFRRLFALKVLRSHLAHDPQAATKFLEEARLAGHVHHPNVVSVLDAGFHGPQPYLVMDYVEGASLKHLLSIEPTSRPAELIVPIILDALAGLHAAHTLVGEDGRPLQIVHCDVSPENLIVGVDGICRLSDFGVARHGVGLRDRPEVAQGKPGYLAPEQILRQRVDQRADVFAMGVVLYNAITGTRLFEAPTVEETLRLVCTAPIEPPSTVGLRPTPSLDFVCMKALERDPSRRFATADEMMDLLRRIALREGLLAGPVQVSAWVKRLVGPELTQRRLALLDLTRRGNAGPSAAAPAAPSAAPAPAPAGFTNEPLVGTVSSQPPGDGEISQTVFLNVKPKRPWALIVASVLAAVAVIATLLWPSAVSRLFHVKTEGDIDDMGARTTPRAPAADDRSGAPFPSAQTPR